MLGKLIDFVITEVNIVGDKLSLLAMCNVYIDGKDVVIAKTKGTKSWGKNVC